MRVSVGTHAQRRIDSSAREGSTKHFSAERGRDCSEMRPFKLGGPQAVRLFGGGVFDVTVDRTCNTDECDQNVTCLCIIYR